MKLLTITYIEAEKAYKKYGRKEIAKLKNLSEKDKLKCLFMLGWVSRGISQNKVKGV